MAAQLQRRSWPLLPLAPAVVVALGIAVAVAIGLFGLDQLGRASDEHAAVRAEILADTLGARLARVQPGSWLPLMQRAARSTQAEYLVITRAGDVVADATLSGMDRQALLRVIGCEAPNKCEGDDRHEAITGVGRTRYAIKPLEAPPATDFLVVFVKEPPSPEGTSALLRALLALTTLLVGVAVIVAYAVARDANRDVEFVAQRVRGMVHVRTEPTGEAVPVRTMDEVGALTSAFNELVGRFAAASKKYRDDLERVRSADRDRAAFLAAVSHELRSPLNAILGFADVLMTEVDGPLTAAAREEVEQIKGSGQHLLDLINDILEFSAIESGQLKLTKTRFDVTLLASEVAREAAGAVVGRAISIRVDGPPVFIQADTKRMRQVLTNLVANAVKFTQEGEVVVAVSMEPRYARISVTDTGPGISAAERAVIFEEYKQTKEERRKKRGTGLGLAIARRLVLMHGGNIQVDSELGQGSTFRVTIPATGEPPARPSWKVKIK
jgi:signal transduction histidine kinase